MPAVTFDLNAKQESAVRAFLETERAAEKAERKVKEVGKTGSASFTSIVAGAVAATGAVAALQKAWHMLSADMRESAKMAEEFVKKFANVTANAGLMGSNPALRQGILKADMPGMNAAARMGLLDAVAGALPSGTPEQIMAIVRKAGQGRKAGMDDATVAQFGKTMAELSKAAPGELNQGDLADVAKGLMERLGRHGSKFEGAGANAVARMRASGVGLFDAVGMLTATVESGGSPEMLAAVADKLAGVKAAEQRMGDDPAAKARLDEIEAERSRINAEQESLRRRGVDAGNLPEWKKKGVGKDLDAKEEALRRREFELGQEADTLRGRQVALPLSPEETAQNELAAMSSTADRWNAVLADPTKYRSILGENTSKLQAAKARLGSASEDFEGYARNDLFTERQRQFLGEDENRLALSADENRAQAELSRLSSKKLIEQENMRAFIERDIRETGGSVLEVELRRKAFDAQVSAGSDNMKALAGAYGSVSVDGEEISRNMQGALRRYNQTNNQAVGIQTELDRGNGPIEVKVVNDKLPLGGSGRNAGDESSRPSDGE